MLVSTSSVALSTYWSTRKLAVLSLVSTQSFFSFPKTSTRFFFVPLFVVQSHWDKVEAPTNKAHTVKILPVLFIFNVHNT